jgi:hypothetical protein
MPHNPIPPKILEERFRKYVQGWRDHEVYELSEGHSGHLFSSLQAELGKEFGNPDTWRVEVGASTFLSGEERRFLYALARTYVRAEILELTAGPQSRAAWSGIYITPEGRERLEGGTPIPEDVEVYLTQLRADAPEVDDTAVFYVREALLAFRARLYPSAVVMLGCAAEHLVLLMAEDLLPKLKAGEQTTLKKALERGPISGVWSAFRPRFEQHRTTIFAGQVMTSETALDGLFLAVKSARDDGGHPQRVQTTEGAARALLYAFPEYAKAASRAIAGIKTL